ncbi:helix-turn-helix transcriptional regulator [Brevibacillus choshinensis]|uniref:WYL domain-containing transcriptional regulator n=1 Tax=Brevibacillus choshinensis TaxID=54911 RepID=A0ABX7FQD0_BRECH|nr:WYL domain-containing protein [Brevibacillus choshinensis]QRG67210.1 WYL domain-containing transcriptional regulator [Brevibacillus choshinensis]
MEEMMGRLGNMLRLWMILKNHSEQNPVGINKLSRELEIRPRMIREYIRILQDEGWEIESKRGRYGGYFLASDSKYHRLLPIIGLSQEEQLALYVAKHELSANKVDYSREIEQSFEKILGTAGLMNSLGYNGDDRHIMFQLGIAERLTDEDKHNYWQIYKAIVEKRKVNIYYNPVSQKKNWRVIHPYAIWKHQHMTYVRAFCENANRLLTFKLNRILQMECLEQPFERLSSYNPLEDISYRIGVSDDEVFDLKLRLTGWEARAIFEQTLVENYLVGPCPSGEGVIFSARMKGKEDIKRWILGMGREVQVVEPASLKKELFEEVDAMRQNFLN